jgi:hypothetical protein
MTSKQISNKNGGRLGVSSARSPASKANSVTVHSVVGRKK